MKDLGRTAYLVSFGFSAVIPSCLNRSEAESAEIEFSTETCLHEKRPPEQHNSAHSLTKDAAQIINSTSLAGTSRGLQQFDLLTRHRERCVGFRQLRNEYPCRSLDQFIHTVPGLRRQHDPVRCE